MISHSPTLCIDAIGFQRENRWLFRALKLTVKPREFLVIIGPSGAGKSTLLYTLAGLSSLSEGSIHYQFEDPQHDKKNHSPQGFQSKIGFIYQKLNLTSNNTVLQNILSGCLGQHPWWKTLFSFPTKNRKEAQRILQELKIESLASKWISEVSGGEQQRTAIGRTLLQSPEIILADEPVSHLDLDSAHQALMLLKNYGIQKKAPILCVLHQPELIQHYADWILDLSPEHPHGWKLTSNLHSL